MNVVLDIGCHTHAGHPGDESVHELVRRYKPDRLYGFDPHPDVPEGWHQIDGSEVLLTRSAAWTYDGTIAYDPRPDRPLAACVGEGPETVRCFDLAHVVGPGDIVKIDAEGAEYPLLAHLIKTGADERISLLLVEWHPPFDRRPGILKRLRCPVEVWQ